jgi:hypothetical protein
MHELTRKDLDPYSGTVGSEVVLECVVSVDSSLLQESEVFWTRDTRGTDSLRTALAIIRYCRIWAAAYTSGI